MSLLTVRLHELANGAFVAKSEKHEELTRFCKKHRLDATATKHLIEVMLYREKEHETNLSRDMDKLGVHLEHSSAPSKLVSMKLKEIRNGCSLSAVWHCCGDSKRRRDKEKELLVEGGPSIEGIARSKKLDAKKTPHRSYTDR